MKKEREESYKPKILIDVQLEQSQQREKEMERERVRGMERQRNRDRQKQQKDRFDIAAEPIDSDSSDDDRQTGPSSPKDSRLSSKPSSHRGGSESRDSFNNINSNDDDMSRNSLLSNTPTPSSPSANAQGSSSNSNLLSGTGFSLKLNLNDKKKKIDVKDVFAMDDESEEVNGPKKRKLVPLGKKFQF